MKFTLVKGVPERLEEYREVFYGSKLYDAYFAEGDSLNENLLRAMADGDLYVAMSPGDEAVGVMYMTRNGLARPALSESAGCEKEVPGPGHRHGSGQNFHRGYGGKELPICSS